MLCIRSFAKTSENENKVESEVQGVKLVEVRKLKGVFWFADFHTHFQEFIASKRQKIMTRIFLLNKVLQCLPHILF